MSITEQITKSAASASGKTPLQSQKCSLTLAEVTNITDPNNLNRVKCKPITNEEGEETDWCYVMTPMGGKEYGQFFFPNVGDLVVIDYIGSDPHRPIVLGCFWNNKTTSPYKITDGKNETYSIKTPNKTEILISDVKDKYTVSVTLPSGNNITIEDEKKTACIKDKSGDNAVSIDFQNGKIEIKAKQSLALSAGQTTLTLDTSGTIEAKSNKSVTLDSTEVAVKAKSKSAIKSATVEVSADASLDLKSSGVANLKGSMVNIN